MILAHTGSPYISIYKRDGDISTRLPDPTNDLPAGATYGCSLSSDNNYLAVVHATTPFISIYHIYDFILTINTIPSDATVQVKIHDEWIEKNEYNVGGGVYNYIVSKEGYATKTGYITMVDQDETINITLDETAYQLTINTTPPEATASIRVNEMWIPGKSHYLAPGNYTYKVSMYGYEDKAGFINITDDDEVINVNLVSDKYLLTFNTTPNNSTIEVKIDNNWVANSTYWLSPDAYDYRISASGYETKTGSITINNKNENVVVNLVRSEYQLTINTIPSDAEVEVEIDNNWEEGNVHYVSMGSYNYRVISSGYGDKTGSITITDMDREITVNLDKKVFNLTIDPTPSTAIAEVNLEEDWISGRKYNVEPDSYDYRVSMAGYETETGSVDIIDDNETVFVTLNVTTYELDITTVPSNATAEVQIGDTWVSGKTHNLTPGVYEYRVSMNEYNTKTGYVVIADNDMNLSVTLTQATSTLTINTLPTNATVEVEIDNIWVEDNEHELKPGTYNYRVSLQGYITKTGTVTIDNGDKELLITLDKEEFNLIIATVPFDAITKLKINNEWVTGNTYTLEPGTYDYTASANNYVTKTGSIQITNEDKTSYIALDRVTYSFIINTTPSDAITEVKIENEWVSSDVYHLLPGDYEYKISKTGYGTVENTVSIVDENIEINIILIELSKYKQKTGSLIIDQNIGTINITLDENY